MNVSEKIYTEFIGLKLTKEEYDIVVKALKLKKKDKLSVKVREFLLSSIKAA